MAQLGRWTGSAALVPTTSWAAPSNVFSSEARNDGSIYTFDAATSKLTLPASNLANGYLVIAAIRYNITHNNRANFSTRFTLVSGTGNFVSAAASGYARDTSEDMAYVRCWAFINNPSTSAEIDFRWKRDADSPTGSIEDAVFEVVPLDYADGGFYGSTDVNTAGNTTLGLVGGWTGVDGTNITESAANVFTLTGDNKKYLILGSQYFEGLGTTRTQRWHHLTVDDVEEPAAKAYSYYRNGNNNNGGDILTWMLETGTANVDLRMEESRGAGVANLQGGADVPSSAAGSGAQHALVILELHDTAEAFCNIMDTQSAELAVTGPVDMNIATTTGQQFNDAAGFTRSSDTQMNAEKAMDVLLGANISAASNNVASATRWTAAGFLTKNGTEDLETEAGDYMRNNQGSEDTFGWSANLLSFMSVALNDKLGVSVQELAGTEMTGSAISPAGWVGFWGLNLDSLAGGPVPPTITDAGGDEDFRDKDTGIVITGTSFEASQGTGTVELSDNSDYATGTKVAQTVTGWNDTTITITVDMGAFSPGNLYLWVTNDTGDRNATGFVVTVHRAKAFELNTSAQFTDGAATTQQLTGGTGSFQAGSINDASNPAASTDLTNNKNSEHEWSFRKTANAIADAEYDFRITNNGVLLDTYTDYPRWINTAGGTPALVLASVTQSQSLGEPTIAHKYTVTPTDLSQAHILDEPSISYQYTITAQDLTQGQTLDATTVTAFYAVNPDDMAQAHVLEDPSVAVKYVIAVQDLAQAHSLEATTVLADYGLNAADLSQTHLLVEPTLVQQHILAPADLGQDQSLDGVTLIQKHNIAPLDLAQAHEVTEPSLLQGNALAAQSLSHTHLLESLALVQHHVLNPNSLDQTNILTSPALTQNYVLSPDGLTQPQTLEEAGIIASAFVVAQNLSQSLTLSQPTLVQFGSLAPNAVTQAHTLAEAILTQNHILLPVGLQHTQALDSPILTQNSVLSVSDLIQALSVEATNLVQQHIITPDSLQQAHTVAGVLVLGAGVLESISLPKFTVILPDSTFDATLPSSEVVTLEGAYIVLLDENYVTDVSK